MQGDIFQSEPGRRGQDSNTPILVYVLRPAAHSNNPSCDHFANISFPILAVSSLPL